MRAMDAYLAKLLAQRAKRPTVELTWELRDALVEKLERGAKLSASERAALHYCTVSNCDGIEEVIDESPESIGLTAGFANKRGLKETGKILANAAKGVPYSEPVSFAAGMQGQEMTPLDVELGEWGATDVVLSLIDEDLDAAILDFAAENLGDFDLEAPAEVADRGARDDAVAKLARAKSALVLMNELLAHRKPRIRAQLREDERTGKATDWLEVPVKHRSGGRADAKEIAALRRQYGRVAGELLDLYAEHDGCELFVANRKPGFRFVPIGAWSNHRQMVMDWATQVTWSQDPEELPAWLESAIPFGWIEGDSERWILVTEGPHAGRVMLSDTDVIDEEPRFQSVGEVVASLTVDTMRVLGCGGYLSYGKNDAYYPEKYEHD